MTWPSDWSYGRKISPIEGELPPVEIVPARRDMEEEWHSEASVGAAEYLKCNSLRIAPIIEHPPGTIPQETDRRR